MIRGLFFAAGVCATILGIGGLFAYAILQPVASAAKGSKPTNQFHTCDFFALSVLLSPPLLFLSAARNWIDRHPWGLPGITLVAVTIFVWWRGATILSGLHVDDARRRFVALAFVLPVALIGGVVAAPWTVMMSFFNPLQLLEDDWPDNDLVFFVWLAGVLLLPPLTLGFRRISKWVVAGDSTRQTHESSKSTSPA